MKRIKLLTGLMLAATLLAVTSCEKSDDFFIRDVEGTYIGSFSQSTNLKAEVLDVNNENNGIAKVLLMGEGQIQVHCYGDDFDTTFMLDVYAHNDEYLVCQTGSDFQNEYGHAKGSGHMDHMSNSLTEWMHHMDDEHEDGDDHFGGFNMQDGTFTYSFRMTDDLSPYYLKFHGIKE